MTFMDSQDLDKLTGVDELKEIDKDSKAFYVDLSNNLLLTLSLDSSRPGFALSLKYCALRLAESLFLSAQEDSVRVANKPYKSEKIGSFSYTRFDKSKSGGSSSLFDELPSIVQPIIKRYLKNVVVGSVSTRVFTEEEPNTINGDRQWFDLLDVQFQNKVRLDGRYVLEEF